MFFFLVLSVFSSLCNAATDGGEITVLIHFKSQFDLSRLPAHSKSRTGIFDTLKSFNQKSVGRVLTIIPNMTEIIPLFLTNSLRAKIPRSEIERLTSMSEVERVEIEQPKEIDRFELGSATLSPGSGTHGNIAYGVQKIEAPKLWDQGIKGQGIVVAMIDSGANITHPDLASNIWINTGETGTDGQGRDKRSNGVDDDGNGFVDDVTGWNFDENNNNVSDKYGHGSMTAGIVAGDGALGTQTGVAPQAKLMIVKACCRSLDSVLESNILQALQYAALNGANVISMSMTLKPKTGPSYSKWRRLDEVLLAAGIIHVNSAGNLGSTETPNNLGAPATDPPAWKHPMQSEGGLSAMLSVGATNFTDQQLFFSSTGPVTWENIPGYNDYPYANGQKPGLIKPDICAPSGVTSTSMDGKSYIAGFQGTSASTPHVAGAAALILSAMPELTVAQLTEALQMSAVKVDSDFTNHCGAGRVDAATALNYAHSHF